MWGNGPLLWHPKRAEVAVGSSGASWRLLDVETGKLGPAVAVPGGFTQWAWHPDGQLLATNNEADFKITFWDIRTRQPAQPPMEGPKGPGVVLRFNHAGDRLLNTDWSGLWRLWDVRTGQQLLTMPAGGAHLQFSPDNSLVGVDVAPHKVRLHRLVFGRRVRHALPLGRVRTRTIRGYATSRPRPQRANAGHRRLRQCRPD